MGKILVFLIFFIVHLGFASENIQKMLNKAWNYYEKGEYLNMKLLSEDILEKSLKENYPKGILEGYYYLGIANFSLGNTAKALEYAKKAVEFSQKYKNYRWKAYSHVLVGEILRSLRRYKEALIHFKTAYKLALENNNEKMVPPSLINIGNIYYDKGNFKKAAEYYKKALEKAEKINLRKSYIAFSSYNLGITYYRGKDYKNAEKYLKKAIDIYRELGNRKGIIESKFYLAKAYMKSNQKEKAKKIFKEVIKETDNRFVKKRAQHFLKKLVNSP